jgi:hypothetical protein
MTKRHQLTRPEVRRTASFHTDQARLQAFEEPANLSPAKASANNNITGAIYPMYLKNVLGQIKANYRNIHLEGSSLMWR